MGTSGRTPPEANLLDKATWINKADYERTKSKAYAASTTASGIKGDITLLKAELAGVTALSIGYSLFKIDEKGISYRGKMLYAAKYADAAKHFQVKMERYQEKAIRDHEKLQTQVNNLATLRTDRDDQESKVADATARRNRAARIHRDYPHESSGGDLQAAEAELRRELQAAQKLDRKITETRRRSRNSLSELRNTLKEVKERKDKFDKEKARLQVGIESTKQSLGDLQKSITGVAAVIS